MADLVCNSLATKEELQELRDQLNEYFGSTEDGSKTEIFQLGKGTEKIAGLLAVTMLGLTHTNAGKAITDITLQLAGEKQIWKQLADGTAKLIGFKGNGAKVSLTALDTVSKTAGQGAGAAATGAKVASGAAAALSVLASLVQIAASLGLNIATVKVLEKRIEAEARGTQFGLDHVNQSMISLYEKNQGDIDRVKASLSEADRVAELNRQNIEDAQNQILILQQNNLKLVKQLKDMQSSIDDLLKTIEEAQESVSNLEEDYQQTKVSFQKSLDATKSQLEKAKDIINNNKIDIEKVNEDSELLKERVTNIVQDIDTLKIESADMRADFEALKRELGIEDPKPEPETKRRISRKIIYREDSDKSVLAGGGGGGASLQGIANTQNAVLDLTKKLTKNTATTHTKIETFEVSNSNRFRSIFEGLLNDVSTGTDVDEQQIADLKTGISGDVSLTIDALLKSTVIPRIDKIDSPQFDRRMANATKTGICESLNGGSCPATPGNPNPTQGLGGMQKGLGDQLGGLNALLNGTILTVVKNTNEAVRHTKFGLEAAFNFGEIAWRATRVGKILEYLSLVATIHNAAMLSRNLGGSLGDAVSAIANNTISLLKNEQFEEIDINKTLGTSIEGFLKGLIGAENYTGVSETLSKYNRIINSASNVIYSITSIQAGLSEGLETIGNYTGRIGNALKKSGAVLESSYSWMSEKVSVKTGRLGQIQRILDTGEGVENFASDIQNATSEFREAQENVTSIKKEYNKVKQEFIDQETEKTETETTTKSSSQGAQPALTDFAKDSLNN